MYQLQQESCFTTLLCGPVMKSPKFTDKNINFRINKKGQKMTKIKKIMDKRQKKTKTNTVFNNKTRFSTNKNNENKW